jgi:exosortase
MSQAVIQDDSAKDQPAAPDRPAGAGMTMPAGWILACLLPSLMGFAWLITKASWFWRNNPDLQFGWIVVMLCGYLLLEQWETRPPFRLRWTWPGLGLMALVLPWLFIVQVYQVAFGTNAASVCALALGVLGLTAANFSFVFGWRGVRHFAFTAFFFCIALPLPSMIHDPVVSTLQSLVASINVELLGLIGIPAQKVGTVIHLPNCTVGVDEACSGIRSLQSGVMMTLFLGQLILKRPFCQGVLLVAGVGMTIIGNLARAFYLSLTASRGGTEALHSVHDQAGWSVLVITLAGISAAAWLLQRLEAGEERMAKEVA